MKVGLKLWSGGVDTILLSHFHDAIDALLLGMQNNNRNDQHRVDGEDNDSCGTTKARAQGGGKVESILAPIEKDSQRASQYDAEHREHRDKHSKQARLESRANRQSAVDYAPNPAGAIRIENLRKFRRKLAGCRIQAGSYRIVSNRNLDVDLRSAALRTKRSAVFDQDPAFLAGMLHPLKLAHNEPESKAQSGAPIIASSGHH